MKSILTLTNGMLILAFFAGTICAQGAAPRSLDDRLEITLFAENPVLNTPTGIDVDSRGRVWDIESNTHFPPEGYDGHPTDRLLILEDTNGDGKAEAKMFVDGFTHSMSVAVRPVWLDPVSFSKDETAEDLQKRTQVYLATRREIFLLEDTDGDDRCDKQTSLVHLVTEGNYPHNGLAGFAFDALGNVFFGFGENLGADYKIIGRDGTTYHGGGEGGNIYRMQPDGTKLQHWATGFWNPHASCVDAFGRLFSVDNDPDSMPPCRLLHIIEGGDYGYRYRNGRKGLHPFTAWNGEIPGTLPMVSGTGEAPSGILAYEHGAFPKDYLGNLIVTSWGDHRIDRFRLKPKGASFESVAEPFVVGGENFRPVGIALAPDGSLYLSDWVLREYKLHKRGRVWRIAAKNINGPNSHATKDPREALSSNSLLKRRVAATTLRRSRAGRDFLLDFLREDDGAPRARLEALWALARIPIEVVDLRLAKGQDKRRQLWLVSNEELSAGLALLGTPQFPWDGDFRSIEGDSSPFELNIGHDPDAILATFNAILMNPRSSQSKTREIGLLALALMTGDPFICHAVYMSQLRRKWAPHTSAELDTWATAPILDEQSAASRATHRALQPEFGLLLARAVSPGNREMAKAGIEHANPMVRRLAVQWIAEEKLTELRPKVEALFEDPALTPALFLATLAALEMLDGKNPKDFDQTPPGKYVLPILKDESKPPGVRAIALRLIDPADPELDPQLVRSLTEAADPKLRREAIRTAAMNPHGPKYEALLKVADDEGDDVNLRAEALGGIARRAVNDGRARKVIENYAQSENRVLAREAKRALRVETSAHPVEPFDADAPADPEAGRRLFYHPQGPGCFKCHTIHGRGGHIGPDLSTIGASSSPEKLAESIRKPSQEVAPQFTTWSMVSTDGRVYEGMIVHENKGDTVLGRSDGTTVALKTEQVEERTPQKTSVMPEKLEQHMTEREFRDLLSFLETLQ